MNTITQFENLMLRHGIGIDPSFFQLASSENAGFPPHNIEQLEDDRFRLTLAVAGFSKDDITITLHNNLLMVEGSNAALAEHHEDVYMLYRGIGRRNFLRQFKVGEHVIVERATIAHGLLQIELVRELPEIMKPRRITLS